MEVYSFLTDQLPFGYSYNFDNFLFNKIAHINTQEIDERVDYFIVNNIKKRIEAKIHFLIHERAAFSPYRSLFGSFEFNPRLQTSLLSEFIAFIERDLAGKNIKSIHITHPAACYSEIKAEKIEKVLIENNFEIALKAINHHIPIDEIHLNEKIHTMEQRKLRKASDNSLLFNKDQNTSASEIYDYIELCRKEKELKPSISKEKLILYLNHFPQNYFLFTVRQKNEILAATVAIKVHKNILYNFLPASLKQFNEFSPMVMLLGGLYDFAHANRFEILDLGISTKPNGTNQQSLIQFKERMGGIRSNKNTYSKALDSSLK